MSEVASTEPRTAERCKQASSPPAAGQAEESGKVLDDSQAVVSEQVSLPIIEAPKLLGGPENFRNDGKDSKSFPSMIPKADNVTP